ncbi:branched-chain alpha-keto acid dehydrogenase subunit e2 [Nannochloropsis oceanica]
MTSGKVRWLKAEGEAFACYDIIAEVSTSTLVEEAYRDGKFKGEVTLLIEAQEDGYLARIFQHDHTNDIPVGTPVGVLCEEINELADTAAVAAVAQVGSALPKDLYSPEAQQKWRVWGGWQAYLKDGGDGGDCSS